MRTGSEGGWEEWLLVERINRGESGRVGRIISSVKCQREMRFEKILLYGQLKGYLRMFSA